MISRRDTYRRQRALLDRDVAVASLRHMALLTIFMVLDRPVELQAPGPDETAGANALIALLSQDEAPDRAGRRASRILSSRFFINDPPLWNARQAGILASAIGGNGWQAFGDEVIRRLFGHGPTAPPEWPHFITALVQEAWNDPAFHLQVSAIIRNTLRQEVIMHPAGGIAPVLSEATWWLLIDLAGARVQPRGKGRAGASLRGRIAAKARAMARSEGWAGFWDQYVLMRALGRFSVPAPHIAHLPLLADREAAFEDEARQSTEQARPGWRLEAPGYAPMLLARRL